MKEDSRHRIARRRARQLGLRMVRRGNTIALYGDDGVVVSGCLPVIEEHLRACYVARRPGPHQGTPPAGWGSMIDGYLRSLIAAGASAETVKLRRRGLATIARGLGCRPEAVTAARLVDWFGRQTHWAAATRHVYRSAARSFFSWAYRTERVSVYLGDALPQVRQPKPTARPASDQAWRHALENSDARTTVMLRLAGQAGLRRAEVAQVHTRDLTDGIDGAQLLVHGKGGKERIVPISDSLADAIRRGAEGHTPGMPERGWLFPAWPNGGHLTADHVGILVARALPDEWTMHSLRHLFSSRAYRGTRNLRAVQELLGHSSIATTERYLAVDDSEIRAAMVAAQ
jgi:integrase/recombinase XerC